MDSKNECNNPGALSESAESYYNNEESLRQPVFNPSPFLGIHPLIVGAYLFFFSGHQRYSIQLISITNVYFGRKKNKSFNRVGALFLFLCFLAAPVLSRLGTPPKFIVPLISLFFTFGIYCVVRYFLGINLLFVSHHYGCVVFEYQYNEKTLMKRFADEIFWNCRHSHETQNSQFTQDGPPG